MKKTQIGNKYRYSGKTLGFKYSIVLDNDADFEVWLKKKLERYVLGSVEIKVLKQILGV